jgi:hypothetical protein
MLFTLVYNLLLLKCKTEKKYMKKIMSLVFALVIIGVIQAQDTISVQGNKDEIKKKRKEEKAAIRESEFQQTKAIVDSRSFVLEADFLANQRGRRTFVNQLLNFIMIDSLHAVVQIGSNRGLGYNGVGGVTADGKITKWDAQINDKTKSVSIRMSFISIIGIYDIFMNIGYSGDATATLSGLSYGQLTFEGQILPKQESAVFKGNTTY